jgi:hypothetical protein
MNTENHLFHLRHVWDVSQQPGAAPMYLAFVDLKQAYDRVSRPLLWTALDFIGVQGAFLAAIQSLYSDVQMAVRLPSGPSPYFPCGLRQGCPLSPTLFTLFFDHLMDYLRATDFPSAAPDLQLDGGDTVPGLDHPLRALLFADDVVLVARSRAGLQALLTRMHFFCKHWQLELNVSKTKAMRLKQPKARTPATPLPRLRNDASVLRQRAIARRAASAVAEPSDVQYAGEPLEWVDQ